MELSFLSIDLMSLFQCLPVRLSTVCSCPGVVLRRSHRQESESAGFQPTAGQSADFFRNGRGSGYHSNSIDGVDYGSQPNSMIAMHANKGITFDLAALRSEHDFSAGRFQTLLGNGGAEGHHLDVAVFLDGKKVDEELNYPARGRGREFDIELPAEARFLTLLVTEGAQGISHDQAILGNPRIVHQRRATSNENRREQIAVLSERRADLQRQLDTTKWEDDPLGALLWSRESPAWIPIEKVHHLLSRQQRDAFRGVVNQLDAIAVKHKHAAARAMPVTDAKVLYDPVIFQRGDPAARGNPVPRQFPGILAGPDRRAFRHGSGRLDLANAIASPTNPLTARVWVNRVWMHHFGEPLVNNPDDFGLNTPQPVYHELLDYLAMFLVENGWQTKPLHELIMTSAAWQRASRIPETGRLAEQLQADPDNRLIWHANRRRLNLEQMRDTILFVSGQLDNTMFGRPTVITDANNKRRTVYAFVERQNLPNIIQTFDFANADTSTPRRTNTTVPQQALFAMNSTLMIESAGQLAACTESDRSNRVQQLYELVLGRAPDEEEMNLATKFLVAGSLKQLAQVLLMSNELMFVD